MKIVVLGTRGIPYIPGGVEKHCQELFPRIADRENEVYVCARNSYVRERTDSWNGVKIIYCYAPRKKSIEALVHTFIALMKARMISPDIVHFHAIGPSLLVPLGRVLGLRVVVTNHGPEYNRQKWGKVAKTVLKISEKVGGVCANEIIVISKDIKNIIKNRCKRNSHLIFNGVDFPEKCVNTDYLRQIGVEPKKYILAVARFVPEKGLHDLINAFQKEKLDAHLVIAGDADHETNYSRSLKEKALSDNRIVLTGYISGDPLNQLYTHASLFVLPSYHEGLPIVLLEAMSYDLPVLVSDISANKAVQLPDKCFFRCGNVPDLQEKMKSILREGLSSGERDDIRKLLLEKYNWDIIAEQTITVYKQILKEAVK